MNIHRLVWIGRGWREDRQLCTKCCWQPLNKWLQYPLERSLVLGFSVLGYNISDSWISIRKVLSFTQNFLILRKPFPTSPTLGHWNPSISSHSGCLSKGAHLNEVCWGLRKLLTAKNQPSSSQLIGSGVVGGLYKGQRSVHETFCQIIWIREGTLSQEWSPTSRHHTPRYHMDIHRDSFYHTDSCSTRLYSQLMQGM